MAAVSGRYPPHPIKTYVERSQKLLGAAKRRYGSIPIVPSRLMRAGQPRQPLEKLYRRLFWTSNLADLYLKEFSKYAKEPALRRKISEVRTSILNDVKSKRHMFRSLEQGKLEKYPDENAVAADFRKTAKLMGVTRKLFRENAGLEKEWKEALEKEREEFWRGVSRRLWGKEPSKHFY